MKYLHEKNIRQVTVCITFLGISLFLASCSSTGYKIAPHNGKYYYIPEKCEQYRHDNLGSDEIKCVHKGQLTGQSLWPANRDDVAAYQKSESEAINDALRNLNESSRRRQENRPKTTNCMNLGYGQISCTTY